MMDGIIYRSMANDSLDRVSPSVHWSRDGQYIYFVTEGKTESIFRVRVTDGKLEKLASPEGSGDPHP